MKQKYKILSISSAILVMFGFIIMIGLPAPRSSSFFAVGSRTTDYRNLVRYYNDSGDFIGQIEVDDTLRNSALLTGNWLPDSSVSLLVLNKDDSTERVRAIILDQNGTEIQSFPIGRQDELASIISLYYDGDETADLVVHGVNTNSAAIYINPGINGTGELRRLQLQERTDLAKLSTGAGDTLGFVKRADTQTPKKTNKKKKKRIKKLRKRIKKLKRKNKNGKHTSKIEALESQLLSLLDRSFISYTDLDGTTKQVDISQEPAYYRGLPLDGTSLSFVKVRPRSLEVFGTAVNSVRYEKRRADRVLVGHFGAPSPSKLLISGLHGGYRIVDPLSGLSEQHQIPNTIEPTSAQQLSAQGTSLTCEEYNTLFADFEAAVLANDNEKIVELGNQLAGIPFPENCEFEGSDDSSNGAIEDNVDDNFDSADDVFETSEIHFISDTLYLKSNTGDFYGPCDSFENPYDGASRDFLAKNSEGSGIVYLTPGPSFINGRILHNISLKEIMKTTDTGVANNSRKHFRTGGRLPKPAHVFAADHPYEGKTYCWRIPANTTRVD